MARYLSRADLSRIAGKYIDQYYTRFGISKDAPEPIDPERLASAVLGLNVKMLPLCSDGSVLGLTVFQRSDDSELERHKWKAQNQIHQHRTSG